MPNVDYPVKRLILGDKMNKQESAEAIALQALTHLLTDDELLMQFFAASGADAGALRAGAGDPVFLAAVVDFLLAEDARVLGFAAATGHRPEVLIAARQALPGGDLPAWT